MSELKKNNMPAKGGSAFGGKYFFSILFILAIAHPAQAAMTVKGEVPEIPPVMTPPPFVEPNIKNNAQYSNPEYLQKNPGNVPTGGEGGDEVNSTDAPGAKEPVYKKSSLWIWLFFIFAGLSGVFVWLKKKNQVL